MGRKACGLKGMQSHAQLTVKQVWKTCNAMLYGEGGTKTNKIPTGHLNCLRLKAMRLAEWNLCCANAHAACMYSIQHAMKHQNTILYVVLNITCQHHDIVIVVMFTNSSSRERRSDLHHLHAPMCSDAGPLLLGATCMTHETKLAHFRLTLLVCSSTDHVSR